MAQHHTFFVAVNFSLPTVLCLRFSYNTFNFYVVHYHSFFLILLPLIWTFYFTFFILNFNDQLPNTTLNFFYVVHFSFTAPYFYCQLSIVSCHSLHFTLFQFHAVQLKYLLLSMFTSNSSLSYQVPFLNIIFTLKNVNSELFHYVITFSTSYCLTSHFSNYQLPTATVNRSILHFFQPKAVYSHTLLLLQIFTFSSTLSLLTFISQHH